MITSYEKSHVVAPAGNPSIWEVKAGRLEMSSSPACNTQGDCVFKSKETAKHYPYNILDHQSGGKRAL